MDGHGLVQAPHGAVLPLSDLPAIERSMRTFKGKSRGTDTADAPEERSPQIFFVTIGQRIYERDVLLLHAHFRSLVAPAPSAASNIGPFGTTATARATFVFTHPPFMPGMPVLKFIEVC